MSWGKNCKEPIAREKMPSLLNKPRSINKSNYAKCYHPYHQLYFQECKWLAKHGVSLRLRNSHAFFQLPGRYSLSDKYSHAKYIDSFLAQQFLV